MRRPILAAVLLVGLLLAPVAEGRNTLPALFTRQIRAIKAAPDAPAVLLPATMPWMPRTCMPPAAARALAMT